MRIIENELKPVYDEGYKCEQEMRRTVEMLKAQRTLAGVTDAAKRYYETLIVGNLRIVSSLFRMRSALMRLGSDFERYATHERSCNNDSGVCTCGYEEARKTWSTK